MKKSRVNLNKRELWKGIGILFSLFLVLSIITPSQARAQTVVPVLVGFFDTLAVGVNSADGVTCIPATDNIAVVDDEDDMVYIIDREGTVQGQFDISSFSNYASGITYIPEGTYATGFAIVDDNADTVFIVDYSGNLQTSFSTSNFGSTNPQGITYVSSGIHAGKFAIVDASSDSIYFCDDAGTISASFSTTTAGASNAQGLVFIPGDNLYAILDHTLNDVILVNEFGIKQEAFDVNFVSTYSLGGYGIGYDSSTQNFVISDDYEDEIFFVNAQGRMIAQFGTNVFGANDPRGITHIAGTSNFAIVDRGADEVFIIDSNGNMLSSFDISLVPSNYASGIFEMPTTGNFAIVDESTLKVFVVDSSANLIDQVDLKTFGISSASPTGIAFLEESEEFMIADQTRDAVLFVNTDRPDRLSNQMSTSVIGSTAPQGLCLIGDTGRKAIVDNSADEIFTFDSKGVMQTRTDTSWFSTSPQGIAFDPVNQIFAIVDNTNDQVTLLSLPSLIITPPSSCECDLNGDGRCDVLDWLIFRPDWGRTDCPVP